MEDLYQIERWLPLSGYEAFYQISDNGQVRSFHSCNRHVSGAIRKPAIAGPGYYQLPLTDSNGAVKYKYAHVLVALHFVPNPLNLPKVNHKDGNKLNNHYLNLEWCTQMENIHHAQRTGLSRVTIVPLSKIRLMRDAGYMFHEIAEEFGVSTSYIWRLLNKKQNAASATN